MKKFRIVSVFALSFLIICSCSTNPRVLDIEDDSGLVLTKGVVQEDIFTFYDYCETEGFWGQFHSLEERIEATQISEETLAELSTEELLILCITHPLTSIFPAYNCELQAIQVLADRLNVFLSFEKRDDAADVLTEFYSRTVVSDSQKERCVLDDGKYSLSLMACNFFELYISTARIPNVLTGENSEVILQSAEYLYSIKKDHPEIYSWFSYGKELFLNEEVKQGISSYEDAEALYFSFRTNSSPSTKSVLDDFPDLVIGQASLQTKGNNYVSAYRHRELTFTEKSKVIQDLQSDFPSVTIPGDAINTVSSTYNCHAYTWHIVDQNSPAGNFWVNRGLLGNSFEDNLQRYWTNDYYQEVYFESAAEKIYYSSADHSAVKSSIPGYYTSKWGFGPLVTHTPSDCPYIVSGMRYFAHTTNNSGGDGGGNNNGGGDGGNTGGGDEIIDPISTITITGSSSIIVGQTYSYQASQMFDTNLLEWSCSNSDAQISPSIGRTIYFTANSAGTHTLVVEYNNYGIIMGRGTIEIVANY